MSGLTGDALPAGEVLGRIASMAEALGDHPDVGAEVVELLDWVDAFHREGLGRLVEMIMAWRGEIFLEAVAGDEVAGGLLDAYELLRPDAGSGTTSVTIPLPSRRPPPPARDPLLQIRGHELP